MECDLCGQKFANSAEVENHKEQDHVHARLRKPPDTTLTPAMNGLTPEGGDTRNSS